VYFDAVRRFLDTLPERKFQDYWIFQFFQPLQGVFHRNSRYAAIGVPIPRGSAYYGEAFVATLMALYGEILGDTPLPAILAPLFCRQAHGGKPSVGDGIGALRGFLSGQYPRSPELLRPLLRDAGERAELLIRESEVVDDGTSLRMYRHTPSSPESAAFQDALDLVPATEFGRAWGVAWFSERGFPCDENTLTNWTRRPLGFALRTPGGVDTQSRLLRKFRFPAIPEPR
jgi:hypothetical protein